VRFPEIDISDWREVSRQPRDGFSWVAYERI
jgi:dihydrofolate reductase